MGYLVQQVIPKHRINLLGGVSDAGKTRWLIPAMLDWERGLPLLGCASHPVPWAYVIGDRPELDFFDTLATMSISPTSIRYLTAYGAHHRTRVDILQTLAEWDPAPEFIVWEGFSDLCGEYRTEVREFLQEMSAYCLPSREFPRGLTFLGVVESPKQKPYERYPNPRHRISGASAWGYHASTVMLIEGVKGDDALETDERTFWVCAKHAKRRCLSACFDAQGRLIVP